MFYEDVQKAFHPCKGQRHYFAEQKVRNIIFLDTAQIVPFRTNFGLRSCVLCPRLACALSRRCGKKNLSMFVFYKVFLGLKDFRVK